MERVFIGISDFPGAGGDSLQFLFGRIGPHAAFVAFIGRFQIAPEERAISAKFGADYDAYRARVRRWI